MDKDAHYFWAVKLPDPIKQNIHDKMENLKQVFLFQRFVHKSDYHITLAFLGSVDEQKLSNVIEQVSKAIKNVKAFPLQIQGINIFGNSKSPRIFWGAVNQEHALFQLQEIVHEKCQEVGFTLETRPYHPHITIARKWSGTQEFEMEWLDKYNPYAGNPLSLQVNEVVLYKTHVERTPKYEPIAIFRLNE